jgi:shikimate dehydrogenase
LIINRTFERAVELAKLFGGANVLALPWANLPEAMPKADLIVNTTSLGMAGQPELEIDLSPLPDHAVVDDIVYVPLETPLLLQARTRGLRGVGGLSMLLHQAVPGFEHWFGQRPVVTAELRALIEADIRSTLK